MPMAAAPPENLSSRWVGSEEDEEKERADAELRQMPDHVLQDMKLRKEYMVKNGVADRLNDNGKKLCASLDAVCRELARRKLLKEAPHSRGGPTGARAQDEKRCERVVQSKGVTSSGMARDSNNGKITKDDFLSSFGNDVKTGVDISSSERTSRSHGEPNASVKNERHAKRGSRARMPLAAAPPENEVGSEEDDEKKRADAELRQMPDHVLQDMKLRKENMIKIGVADRLNDNGKKLRSSLDAVSRELTRRKLLNEAPHSRGGPTGARPVAGVSLGAGSA